MQIMRTPRTLQHVTVQIAGHEHHANDSLTPTALKVARLGRVTASHECFRGLG